MNKPFKSLFIFCLFFNLNSAVWCSTKSSEAAPGRLTGNQLLAQCTSQNSFEIGACHGYVRGFNNGIEAGFFNGLQSGVVYTLIDQNKSAPDELALRLGQKMRANGVKQSIYCAPESATVKQLVDIVIKYLVEHPEKRADDAVMLIAYAFREAFPCS